MVDTCIFCGEIVPEGRQVCYNCEKKCPDNGPGRNPANSVNDAYSAASATANPSK